MSTYNEISPDMLSANLSKRTVLLADGTIVPITHTYDKDGDETDDYESIVFIDYGPYVTFNGAEKYFRASLNNGPGPTIH